MMKLTEKEHIELFHDNVSVEAYTTEFGDVREYWWEARLVQGQGVSNCIGIGETLPEAIEDLQQTVMEELFAATDEEMAKMPQEIIPEGFYCYDEAGVICPYWAMRGEENGYCHFMRRTDLTSGGLLWDQIKECGVKLGSD